MDIRPQDLPELRAELRAQMVNQKHIRRLWHDAQRTATTDGADEVGQAFQQLIDETELFHIAPPMTELACVAATSLTMFTLSPADLPSPVGLVIFGGHIRQAIHFEDGCTTPLRGAIWGSDETRFMVIPVADPHDGVPIEGRLVAYPDMHFGNDFGEELENVEVDQSSIQTLEFLALILTTWLLMAQPLASSEQIEPDRAAKKRLRRAGHEPAPVRVIELRRPKVTGIEPGESGRSYSHRWITRGHWRQQWYPAREVHRPVWIAPHVKGPEGAPLIGGEKVYAWKR